jgi:hypothetical protein
LLRIGKREVSGAAIIVESKGADTPLLHPYGLHEAMRAPSASTSGLPPASFKVDVVTEAFF